MDKTNKEKVVKRARKKIIANINYIYENLNVEKEIIRIRRKFKIPDNFFIDYKVESDPEFYLPSDQEQRKNMIILLMSTIHVWKFRVLSDQNILDQAIRNIGEKRYESYHRKFTYPSKYGESNYNIICRKSKYVAGFIIDYFLDDSTEINKPMRINQRIWGTIIAAKLFEIPQKTLITYMESMLSRYFPTVDGGINYFSGVEGGMKYFPEVKGGMKIQFNELTCIEDIKYIWSEVEKRQRDYTSRFGIIQKREYLNHDRDKKAYELKKESPEISRKEIKKILGDNKFSTNFATSYITIIIRNYKKFINK